MSQMYFPDPNGRILDYDEAVMMGKKLLESDARLILQENIYTCKKVIAFYDKYFTPPYSDYLKIYTDCSIFQITTLLIQELMSTPALRISAKNQAKMDGNLVVLEVFRNYLASKTHSDKCRNGC